MNALVLAYALRLRRGAGPGELQALLPPEARAEVEAALDGMAGLRVEEIETRLRAHRREQCRVQRGEAGARTGMEMDRIAPELAAWLARPF